ncbi:MAG: ribosome biogenesis GTPase YlqF [Oscillospiraceae bacterium]|nr:ribosome biogenesis GTPase YlqF [Oscillospiraceae bacterium]
MDENRINIQWFPGHMTKAKRMMVDSVKLVDAICEIIDARIPISSRNPELGDIAGGRPRVVILNRTDLADPEMTRRWAKYFRDNGIYVIETDSKSGKGVNKFSDSLRIVLKEKLEQYAAKGQANRPLRVMVAGIPNVGKSTFINKVAGRKAAVAANKPGVTRGKQWITIGKGLELMDTPGLLWPKFDSQVVGENLAFTGAVKDDVIDTEALAANLMLRLRDRYPKLLEARYKFTPDPEAKGWELLEKAARKRGFLISGGEVDTERMAAILLDEFRSGTIGRITLEAPEDME